MPKRYVYVCDCDRSDFIFLTKIDDEYRYSVLPVYSIYFPIKNLFSP